jgi:hypothetical protein
MGVAVAGGYACVADGGAGLRVVDVSDPSNPKEVGSYETPGYATGMAVAGDYAYVTDEGAGLHVVDVSDLYSANRSLPSSGSKDKGNLTDSS